MSIIAHSATCAVWGRALVQTSSTAWLAIAAWVWSWLIINAVRKVWKQIALSAVIFSSHQVHQSELFPVAILCIQLASRLVNDEISLVFLFLFSTECLLTCWFPSPSFVLLLLITAWILSSLLWCQAYTCSNYICPICSKSLGDMAVRTFLHVFICNQIIWTWVKWLNMLHGMLQK